MSATTATRNGDKKKPSAPKQPGRPHIDDLELAGGVEGGMEAGSAGGPGQAEVERSHRERTGR